MLYRRFCPPKVEIKELIALTLVGKGGYFFFITVNTRVITEIITILNWNMS